MLKICSENKVKNYYLTVFNISLYVFFQLNESTTRELNAFSAQLNSMTVSCVVALLVVKLFCYSLECADNVCQIKNVLLSDLETTNAYDEVSLNSNNIGIG